MTPSPTPIADLVRRLDRHIDELERDGAGPNVRMAFDDLCAISAVLEAQAREIKELHTTIETQTKVLGFAQNGRVEAESRAQTAEAEIKIMVQMHRDITNLVGQDPSQAYALGRQTNLEEQTHLICALESRVSVAEKGVERLRGALLVLSDGFRSGWVNRCDDSFGTIDVVHEIARAALTEGPSNG